MGSPPNGWGFLLLPFKTPEFGSPRRFSVFWGSGAAGFGGLDLFGRVKRAVVPWVAVPTYLANRIEHPGDANLRYPLVGDFGVCTPSPCG